jgi:hypothetical protein
MIMFIVLFFFSRLDTFPQRYRIFVQTWLVLLNSNVCVFLFPSICCQNCRWPHMMPLTSFIQISVSPVTLQSVYRALGIISLLLERLCHLFYKILYNLYSCLQRQVLVLYTMYNISCILRCQKHRALCISCYRVARYCPL